MSRIGFGRQLAPWGFLTLVFVLLAGCGKDDPVEPEDPKLTGTWTGQVDVLGSPADIKLEVTEDDDGKVTGTMTYTVLGQSGSGPVTGTHNYPNVMLSLQITFGGMELTGSYAARLDADDPDHMEGTFSTDDGSITGSLAMERASG